ncbi:MAG: hypothetical protein AAB885_02540 [Patescibacteria group bacterium]
MPVLNKPATGGAGISGYEIIVSYFSEVNPFMTALCSSGKKVLGGGCTGQAGITKNLPLLNGSGWQCDASNEIVDAYAICADVE